MDETKIGFANVKVGDRLTRMLAGTIPMPVTVTKLTDKLIVCGPWEFDRLLGGEIDEELGWFGGNESGSILRPPDMTAAEWPEYLKHWRATAHSQLLGD